MSINTVNNIDTNLYINGTNPNRPATGADDTLYQNTPLNFDTFETSLKNTADSDLRKEFKKTKEEQGLIGKAWDGIKNLFNMKNGSDNIEKTLKDYESGQISEEEAKKALENYQNGQKMCVDVVGDITSGIVAVGAAAFAPVTGGASLIVAAGAGAAVKCAIKASDAVFNGREYDLKDLGYDLVTGSLNGAMGPLSNGIGGAVGTGVAKALGLEAVETTAKTAGKGFIAKLLAKGGANYVAKEGVNLGIKTIGAKALAYGADMAIDGALSGAADGFSRAVGEGRTKDIANDTLKGALGGLIAAPVIGGSTRLIFKGASTLGSKVFKNSSDAVSDTMGDKAGRSALNAASDTVSDNIDNISTKLTFESTESALDYLRRSNNPDARTILKAVAKNNELGNDELLKRITRAINVMEDPSTEENLARIAKNLSEQYADNTSVKRTVNELFRALGIDAELAYDAKNKVYKATTDYGDFGARAKGETSVLSKIKKKIFDLKTDIPQDSRSASRLIGDAHGTRIVIKNAALDEDTIQQIVKNSLDDKADRELFLNYFLSGTKEIPKAKREAFKAVEKQIYDKARDVQNGKFINKLTEAIINDDINITELHNYTGADGIPYFNSTQVDRIKEAYDEWFKKMYKGAQESPDTSRFKIFTIDDIAYLEDKNGNIFKANMLIEDISNTTKAVKDSGYTAAQMNIITKDGVLEELQYRGTMVDTIAESEHIPYDIRMGKSTVARKEYDSARAVFDKFKDDKNFVKKYNRYMDDTYVAYRRTELGFSSDIPKIEDYLGDMLNRDEMNTVSIEGLNALRKLIHEIDNQNKG